ncbi:MAG TPA: FecR family protein [Spirochaetia bacterium]|nr:FecR family protein [Spirochaetia bacterium]
MSIKAAVPCILIFFCFSLRIFAGVGEIVYVNGRLEISRNGEILEDTELEIGFPIENYDIIRTGADGELIVRLSAPGVPQSEIHIAANTTFVIELNRIKGKDNTTLGLLTGSLELKVRKFAGNQDFSVRTESATMGVRGTEFQVQTSPASDLLVTCEEGEVVCYEEEGGTEVLAEPGAAVEKQSDEALKSIPVSVSDLRNFRANWIAERIAAFKPNALRVVRFYAVRYNDLYARFNTEYEALMGNVDVLRKWFQEEKQGRVGSNMEILREKRRIAGHLFRIRRVLFIFERIYYRLLELHAYFQEGYGRGEIGDGLSATVFFNRLIAQRRDLALKVGRVRFIMKLYSKRNEGSVPLSES